MKLFFVLRVLLTALLCWNGVAFAQGAPVESGERSLSEWLTRMHEASRRRAYTGTFVVLSDGQMASSRIWHVCDGEKQIERVESLTGKPRATFRRNEEVITFAPEARVAVTERREGLNMFPHLLKAPGTNVEQFYAMRHEGRERVAGFEADVLLLRPNDRLRHGYRIWSERKTGLVIKLQTLDPEERVLEQAAFSELQLDAPVSMDKLARMMGNTEGYTVRSVAQVKTTPAAEGWRLKAQIPGFAWVSCYRRPEAERQTLQWVFTDGLASVSLFLETFDASRHLKEGALSLGATQMLTRRIEDARHQRWWLTAVGEVPRQTLEAFAQSVERK